MNSASYTGGEAVSGSLLCRRTVACVLMVGLLLAAACTSRRSATPGPTVSSAPETGHDHELTGVASWYGEPFHGRRTASGEVYDMEEMTAAHKTLPLGTVVRVKNKRNGQSVVVRINDRGPFVDGRIIDLSRRAARKLSVIGPGTAPVSLEIVSTPSPETHRFTVQVGSFSSQRHARSLADRLAFEFPDVRTVRVRLDNGTYHRVRVGEYTSEDQARKLAARLLLVRDVAEAVVLESTDR